MNTAITFTAVYRKTRTGYVGFVEELPGANSQGRTLAETRRNLAEAVQLILDTNRQLADEATSDVKVIREPLLVRAA